MIKNNLFVFTAGFVVGMASIFWGGVVATLSTGSRGEAVTFITGSLIGFSLFVLFLIVCSYIFIDSIWGFWKLRRKLFNMIRIVIEYQADHFLFSHWRRDYDHIEVGVKNARTPEELARSFGGQKVFKGIVILLAANHMKKR